MNPITILNFHGVGTPHSKVDDSERPYWLSSRQFEDILDKIVLSRKAGHNIEITFDDGNKSDLEIAAPLLLHRGLSASIFVLLGRINDPDYLSPADIYALQERGMTIGLHGRHHLDWRTLDKATLIDETKTAAHDLLKITGIPPEEVAIPFGAYNRSVISHLKKLPFTKIMTSDSGHTDINQRVQARTSLRSDMTMNHLDIILNDSFGIQARMRRQLSQFVRQYIV